MHYRKIAPQKGYDVTIKMFFQQVDQLMHPDSQRILRLICIGCLCAIAFTSESRVHEPPACWQRSVQLLYHMRHFLLNSRSFNIFGTRTRCVGSLWVWKFQWLCTSVMGKLCSWRRSLTTTTDCPFCSASCNHYVSLLEANLYASSLGWQSAWSVETVIAKYAWVIGLECRYQYSS